MQHYNCKCHPYYHASSKMSAPKDWDRVLWIGLPSSHNHPPCSGSAVDKNDRNHQSQINRRHKYTTLTPQRYTTKGDKHCQASIQGAGNQCTTHNLHIIIPVQYIWPHFAIIRNSKFATLRESKYFPKT